MASTKTKGPENGRFAPFIPTLALSHDDIDLLAREADALVQAAVHEYQYYRTGAANWTKWKEVRRVDTVRVFRERQSVTKNDIDTNGVPMLPEVLAIGNVSGTVEDMLYGVMAPSAMSMLANSRGTDEGLCEASVMATLVMPTEDDPFRSLSCKWFTFSLGSGMCSLRDCSMLESTGILTLDNGERLGYVLRHSVSFKGVPDLQPFGVLRANIATWAIYRESGPGMVQCFVKSFHDLGSGTWKTMGLKSICERALALCNVGISVETKKLARLLRSDGWDLLSGRRARISGDNECAVCFSPLGSSLLGTSTRQCRICSHVVCPHCVQKKTVSLVDDDAQRVVTQQLRVCVTCVNDAQRATSFQLQIEEIHTNHKRSLRPPFTSSLTESEASSEEYI